MQPENVFFGSINRSCYSMRRRGGYGVPYNQGAPGPVYAGPGPYTFTGPRRGGFPGARKQRTGLQLRRRGNQLVGQGQFGRTRNPAQSNAPFGPVQPRVRNGSEVFPMYGDLPDPNLVDEGAFAGFMMRVLDENNIRMLGGLTAPLRRLLYVNLYNAFKGLNPHLLNALKQADARQAVLDDGM